MAEQDSPEILTPEQQAIYDIAMAYYDKGKQVQYCDRHLTYKGLEGPVRARIGVTPECATSQETIYSMCSKFIYDVYAEAFVFPDGTPYSLCGLAGNRYYTYFMAKVSEPGSSFYNEKVVVKSWKDPFLHRDAIRQEILDLLQPGDVLVYRMQDSSGHTLLFLGKDTVINATAHRRENPGGGSYDYRNKQDVLEENGTIGITSLAQDVLSPPNNLSRAYSKYVLGDACVHLSILRPLNEIADTCIPSPAARQRRILSRLVIDKTASVNKYDSVLPGDEITYTIALSSGTERKRFQDVPIRARIPAGTRLVAAPGASRNGDSLTWTRDVPYRGTVCVSWTVVVTAAPGSVIFSKGDTVGGIHTAVITTRVAPRLSAQQAGTLYNAVSAVKTCTDSASLIMQAYRAVGITPVPELPGAEALYSRLFEKTAVDVTGLDSNSLRSSGDTGIKLVHTMKPGDPLWNMVVPNLYGGMYLLCSPLAADTRTSWFTEAALMTGDVIAVYDDDPQPGYRLLLYAGRHTIAEVQDEKVIRFQGADTKQLIDSMLGACSFLVLRPAQLWT